MRIRSMKSKKANIYVGEDDELNEKRMILANSEKITEALSASKEIINGGEFGETSIVDQIADVNSFLSSIEDIPMNIMNFYLGLKRSLIC